MTKEDRSPEVAAILKDLESALTAFKFPTTKQESLEQLRQRVDLDCYILKGREIIPAANMLEWCQWMETSEERQVAEDYVSGGDLGVFRVSTIFLGLDHNPGPPILFETMVFGPPEEYKDLQGKIWSMDSALDYQVRYATFAQAEEGHAAMCQEIRKLLGSK